MTTSRKELPQKVEARTAELAQANRRLTQINSRLRQMIDTASTLSFCDDLQTFGS
jgi:fatty acid-binding protein DegV